MFRTAGCKKQQVSCEGGRGRGRRKGLVLEVGAIVRDSVFDDDNERRRGRGKGCVLVGDSIGL